MTLTNDQVLKLVNQIQIKAMNIRPSKNRDYIIRLCNDTIENIVRSEVIA